MLHSIYGFTRISAGRVSVAGRDVTRLPPERKLASCRIAYILQDSSLFPDMTVSENLLMGGYLLRRPAARASRGAPAGQVSAPGRSAAITAPRCSPAASGACSRSPAR